MPNTTPNLGLIKPLVTEQYDIAKVTNENADKIDLLLAPKANPTFTGTQTLPNIVTNGIKFPATQVPSADPNTLDDYEEGTFTPTIEGTTTAGVGTYSTQIGKYTKIGDMVYIIISLAWSAHTGTGTLAIKGLPFSALDQTPLSIYLRGLTLPTGYDAPMALVIGSDAFVYGYNGNERSASAMDSSVSSLMLSGVLKV